VQHLRARLRAILLLVPGRPLGSVKFDRELDRRERYSTAVFSFEVIR
jgi:hypothetical protein